MEEWLKNRNRLGKFFKHQYNIGFYLLSLPTRSMGGERMSPVERRQQLLETLCRRRHDTYGNLANEFGVCKETIRHDIVELMRSYPIETVRGRHGGGVKVEDWFHLNRKTLTPKQANLLRNLSSQLDGDDLDTLNSILLQFAP